MNQEQKIKDLFKWIKNNNGFIHPNIEINEKNRLQLTNKMGAKGVQLFSIPRTLCLTTGDYKNYQPAEYELLNDSEKKIFSHDFFKLIINLISEKFKGKNSFYYPLIASLPQMEDLVKTNPIFYYNERKDVWKKILPTIITKLDSLNEYYINLYSVINKLKVFNKINLKMFPKYKNKDEVLRTIVLWSFLIVNAYAIENSYILPLFNLVHYNHETENRLVMDSGKINFSYESINEKLLSLNNGLLDNETLFTLHGYMNENKKQFIEIKLSNKYNVENEDVKAKIVEIFDKQFDRLKQKYYITKDTPSINLVQYLRILSLSKRDIQFIEGDDEFYTRFISMDNESGVYQKLLKIVQIKYDQIKNCDETYKETDKKDEKILKRILTEQKQILRNMYFEIHKKWLGIMETELDENLMTELFKMK